MSDALPKLDREKLRLQLLAKFEKLIIEVSDAVDDAPDGRWIRDSEEKVRDAVDFFRQELYELAMQAKVDAAEAAFSPSGQCGDGQDKT